MAVDTVAYFYQCLANLTSDGFFQRFLINNSDP